MTKIEIYCIQCDNPKLELYRKFRFIKCGGKYGRYRCRICLNDTRTKGGKNFKND